MVHVALTDPFAYVDQLATWHNLLFLLLMLGPFLGLWALEPLMLVGALPDLAINLLSSQLVASHDLRPLHGRDHPFIVAASILGGARVGGGDSAGRRPRDRVHARRWRPASVLHASQRSGRGQQVDAMKQAKRLIPFDAPISAPVARWRCIHTTHGHALSKSRRRRVGARRAADAVRRGACIPPSPD